MRSVILGAFALVILPAHADEKDDKDLARLQGKWESVSVIDDGKAFDKDKQVKFAIAGSQLHYSKDRFHVIKLDASKSPKHFDLVETQVDDQGKVFHGIYAFDGDGFKICLAKDVGKARPKAFESKEGSATRVIVFKWVK